MMKPKAILKADLIVKLNELQERVDNLETENNQNVQSLKKKKWIMRQTIERIMT